MISLNSELDREAMDSHIFDVIAFDNGVPSLTSTVTVTITVLDINDNFPVFLPHATTYHVSENAGIDYVVATINATDEDIGKFGTIFYEIEAGAFGNFGINDSTVCINRLLFCVLFYTCLYFMHMFCILLLRNVRNRSNLKKMEPKCNISDIYKCLRRER